MDEQSISLYLHLSLYLSLSIYSALQLVLLFWECLQSCNFSLTWPAALDALPTLQIGDSSSLCILSVVFFFSVHYLPNLIDKSLQDTTTRWISISWITLPDDERNRAMFEEW